MLPPEDEDFLKRKGLKYELVPSDGHVLLLILRAVELVAGKFDKAGVDVLFKIPPGYPISKMDMFWTFPEVRLANGGRLPASEVFENIGERTWQRFSRHLPDGLWRPGVDSIRTFIPRALAELVEP